MIMHLNPRLIIPTCGIRSVDEAKIRDLSKQFNQGLVIEPVLVFETEGYLLLIDGHHRWAAHILSRKITDIEVKLLDAGDLKRVSPLSADTIIQEVSWTSVYDWEDALSVRLINSKPSSELGHRPLTVLSGPSGVGKSRILSEISRSGVRLANLATTTTRERREGEVDGKDYDFANPTQFNQLVTAGTFCEWQYVHGNYYGSRMDRMLTDLSSGLRIKDLDAYGALQLKSLYPNSINTVFVDVEEFDIIRSRLSARDTDNSQQAVRRISRARIERELRVLFDQVVINDDALLTSQEILRIASRGTAEAPPVPFFESTGFHGSYVALEVTDPQGKFVVWNNLKEAVVPLLLIPDHLSPGTGVRFLEQIVLDQLSTELKGHENGANVLRSLTKALDTSGLGESESVGRASGSRVFSKNLQCDEFFEFVRSHSKFFSTSMNRFG